MAELAYSSIGRDITVRISLSEMSGRDKSSLFRQLLEESGILSKPRKAEVEQCLQEISTNLFNMEKE